MQTLEIIARMNAIQAKEDEAKRERQALEDEKQAAIDALVADATAKTAELNEVINLLRSFGTDYKSVELALNVKKSSGNSYATTICKVCNIVGHGGHSHRHESNPNRPFTQAELVARGLPGYPVGHAMNPLGTE